MRMDGRRQSGNVDDRRGSSSGRRIGIGGGIVGVILVAVITLLGGGDLGDVFSNVMGSGAMETTEQSSYQPDDVDNQLALFASQVLAGTEDVWTAEFQRLGLGTYRAPKMVLYTDAVSSGCGNATSQVGPFYCSADETVYIDLSFFRQMQQNIGGDGDFAYAYVIAHEVGHHVQHLLGTLDQAHEQMSRLSEREANHISVRLELQADYYAGVWAALDNKMFNSIEPGDIEEAVDVAGKIGDDYLQRKAYGREMPDSFNHGRSEQRVRWFTRGLQYADINHGDTFTSEYSDL
ncbi:MAG: neutral zinc metallopeptidase [Muribaculaceae bacterium]|nr:neutral zinc metallopeptidase [Muribaculaceae bacterium]